MYSAFWLWTIAQALLLPNWIAGFAGLAGFGILFFGRVAREGRMMLQTFGYAAGSGSELSCGNAMPETVTTGDLRAVAADETRRAGDWPRARTRRTEADARQRL